MTAQSHDTLTGEAFKGLLRRVGLSQYRLAKWLPMSKRQITRIARGEYVAPGAVTKLLRVMDRHGLSRADIDLL
jgi:DNA-binding transcriptional regulator YiaG